MHFVLPFVVLSGVFQPWNAVADEKPIEDQIADYFGIGECENVTKLATEVPEKKSLPPLIEAVVGFCEPDSKSAETLLGEASTRDQSDDLIAILRAKKTWMRNRDESMPFWQRALLLARRPSLRNMIQDYITGEAEGNELISAKGMNSFQASVSAAGFLEDNPDFFAISEKQKDTAYGNDTNADLNITRPYRLGTYRFHANLHSIDYFNSNYLDFQSIDADIPVTVKIGKDEDFVITPITGFSRQGNAPLQSFYGISVQGVAYREDYKQSVMGTVYSDTLYPASIKAQSGFHVRFDYSWEWFSGNTTFRFNPFIEHVTSDLDLDTSDPTQVVDIPYTFTSTGVNLSVDQYLGKFVLAADLLTTLRFDDNDSIYFIGTQRTVNTRHDQNIIFRFTVTYPLSPNLQLIGWYEWNRTFSNLGRFDYQDRNVADEIAALGLRYSFFSF